MPTNSERPEDLAWARLILNDGIEAVGSIVFVRTCPGGAQAVGSALDAWIRGDTASPPEGVVATVGGDSSLLVFCNDGDTDRARTKESARLIVEWLTTSTAWKPDERLGPPIALENVVVMGTDSGVARYIAVKIDQWVGDSASVAGWNELVVLPGETESENGKALVEKLGELLTGPMALLVLRIRAFGDVAVVHSRPNAATFIAPAIRKMMDPDDEVHILEGSDTTFVLDRREGTSATARAMSFSENLTQIQRKQKPRSDELDPDSEVENETAELSLLAELRDEDSVLPLQDALLIQTTGARASAIAAEIDGEDRQTTGIAGTVAGDTTILALCERAPSRKARRLRNHVLSLCRDGNEHGALPILRWVTTQPSTGPLASRDVTASGHFVILRTEDGGAPLAGSILDEAIMPDRRATIAGWNGLLLVADARPTKRARQLQKAVATILESYRRDGTVVAVEAVGSLVAVRTRPHVASYIAKQLDTDRAKVESESSTLIAGCLAGEDSVLVFATEDKPTHNALRSEQVLEGWLRT